MTHRHAHRLSRSNSVGTRSIAAEKLAIDARRHRPASGRADDQRDTGSGVIQCDCRMPDETNNWRLGRGTPVSSEAANRLVGCGDRNCNFGDVLAHPGVSGR